MTALVVDVAAAVAAVGGTVEAGAAVGAADAAVGVGREAHNGPIPTAQCAWRTRLCRARVQRVWAAVSLPLSLPLGLWLRRH